MHVADSLNGLRRDLRAHCANQWGRLGRQTQSPKGGGHCTESKASSCHLKEGSQHILVTPTLLEAEAELQIEAQPGQLRFLMRLGLHMKNKMSAQWQRKI